MTIRKRPVSVMQLPKQSNPDETRAFLQEVGKCISVDRPQLVLDCSTVPQLDNDRIHLLLCCLEEAMKRNGDVKLAGLPQSADCAQDLTGVHRLFESFESAPEAVNSFHQFPSHAAPDVSAPSASVRIAESVI